MCPDMRAYLDNHENVCSHISVSIWIDYDEKNPAGGQQSKLETLCHYRC